MTRTRSVPSVRHFMKRLKSHLFSAAFFNLSNCLLLCILCTVIICTVLATDNMEKFGSYVHIHFPADKQFLE